MGIPYGMHNCGIPLATTMIHFTACVSFAAVMLLLKAKELSKQESYFEIGYVVLGRASIFASGIAFIFQNFGVIIIYYIVYSDTVSMLMG